VTLCQLNEPVALRAEQNVHRLELHPPPFALASRSCVKFAPVLNLTIRMFLPGPPCAATNNHLYTFARGLVGFTMAITATLAVPRAQFESLPPAH